jgi:hypothetical protein
LPTGTDLWEEVQQRGLPQARRVLQASSSCLYRRRNRQRRLPAYLWLQLW